MELKQAIFKNAKKLNQQNPDTFKIPTSGELDGVGIGDNVKVCTEGGKILGMGYEG